MLVSSCLHALEHLEVDTTSYAEVQGATHDQPLDNPNRLAYYHLVPCYALDHRLRKRNGDSFFIRVTYDMCSEARRTRAAILY